MVKLFQFKAQYWPKVNCNGQTDAFQCHSCKITDEVDERFLKVRIFVIFILL